MPKWFVLHWRFLGLLMVLGTVLVPFLLTIYIKTVTNNRRFTQPETVPNEPVAIVFGAGVWADGNPNTDVSRSSGRGGGIISFGAS